MIMLMTIIILTHCEHDIYEINTLYFELRMK